MSLPAVCILAGGRGTRLGDRVVDTPKPLLAVAGEPFLLHQLRQLADHGAVRVVLCVGYLGKKIEARIGNEQFGIEIEYSYDGPQLDGTLGAIRRALPLLPRHFVFLYGDTYLRLDFRGAYEGWRESGRLGLMTVLRNEGRWGVSNAVYADSRVVAFDKSSRTGEMKWIDYGFGGLDAAALSLVPERERDLAGLQSRLARRGELYGYEVGDRFYEIGTPEGLRETDTFLGRSRATADPVVE